MSQEFKHFRNRVALYTHIGSLAKGFDVTASSRMVPYSFVIDGVSYKEANFRDFLNKVNELCGTNFDADKSIGRVGVFLLATKSGAEPKVERPVSVEVKEIVEDKPEPVEEGDTDLVAQAESLYDDADKKGSKERLEALAKEQGITLDKRSKFEVMLEDFKKQISK